MSLACPNSRIWFRGTVQCWFNPSCRAVSTTSAINRGLRATKNADGTSRGGRDRSVKATYRRLDSTAKDAPKQVPAFRLKRFTSGGEAPGSAEFWRGERQEKKWISKYDNEERASYKDGRHAVRRSRLSAKQRRQPVDNVINRKEVSSSTAEGVVEEAPKATAKPRKAKDLPQSAKMHPELYRIIAKVELLVKEMQVGAGKRFSRKRPKRQTYDRLLELLAFINQKMYAGEYSKRNVRDALNDRPTKIHIWQPTREARRSLWFDWENGRLEFLLDGEPSTVDAVADEFDKEFDGIAKQERSVGLSKAVRAHTDAERMFTLPPAPRSPNTQQDDSRDDEVPLSIPFTTAASTFLYGTNTVLASLKAKRRQLYKLYLHSQLGDREDFRRITRLAQKAGVRIQSSSSTKLLNKMSEDRPHNGVVLEASSLPAPPVLAVGKPNADTNTIPLQLSPQTAEDQAVNGAPTAIATSEANSNREPFIVLLDGITDPGNVGSILRTCHFYNIDAVAIATNTCANLNSAPLAKASSGACEAIQILALPKPSNFVYESSKAGWRVFAAVAPFDTTSAPKKPNRRTPSAPSRQNDRYLTTATLTSHAPLATDPCILMLGAEGEGLRESLKQRADYFVSIEGGQRDGKGVDVGVDSLNVSAAASVLLEAFMRRA